jgi:hypothetical protein
MKGLLALLLALASLAHAQVYPVVNFRWHDGYVYNDPSYFPYLHAAGIGNFPEFEHVVFPYSSLWFVYSTAAPTCTGTCTDPGFTGCVYGQQNTITWPPVRLGTPVQDAGGGVAGAYARIWSSRAITFATTGGYCGVAGGEIGQKVEMCDQILGLTDGGSPYFLSTAIAQLQSRIDYFAGGPTLAHYHAEQWGSVAHAQWSPTVAFWITGNGTAVESSLDLTQFTDGTARWNGTWSVNYATLGCRLDFPLQAVAVGQP